MARGTALNPPLAVAISAAIKRVGDRLISDQKSTVLTLQSTVELDQLAPRRRHAEPVDRIRFNHTIEFPEHHRPCHLLHRYLHLRVHRRLEEHLE